MKSLFRPLGIIIVSLFGFLLIITFYADRSNFQLSAREMHTTVLSKHYVLNLGADHQFENAMLIDIRDAEHYAISHHPNSVNVPLPSILDKSNLDLFSKDNPKIILAHDPIKANETWMLLTQMGIENLFVMEME